MNGDSLLLWVDRQEMLSLRQVSASLVDRSQPSMRIALGGILLPISSLRFPVTTPPEPSFKTLSSDLLERGVE